MHDVSRYSGRYRFTIVYTECSVFAANHSYRINVINQLEMLPCSFPLLHTVYCHKWSSTVMCHQTSVEIPVRPKYLHRIGGTAHIYQTMVINPSTHHICASVIGLSPPFPVPVNSGAVGHYKTTLLRYSGNKLRPCSCIQFTVKII